ncbi:MAG: hypothetical protein K5649_08985 [Lachnospiraceae bacterium]|nr:hypothetical protein [Lachnospiraceae bacterium]
MNKNNSSFRIEPYLALFAVALFSCFCIPSTEGSLKNPLYLMILFTLLLFAAAFHKYVDYAGLRLKDTFLIMLPGFFIKLCYILYTQVWDRQHDVVDFHAGEGQAAYIEYFLSHKSLPDFDPRSVWGFFQPPLHHIISAIWMKISLFLKLSERQAQENVQALTFFYMGALMLLTDSVCQELDLTKRGRRIAVAIVSLHPIYILLSGSINNDALSLVLMMLALYLAIVWYKRPNYLTIILLALSIALAMFAKLSGGMIAPAVAALFILKLIKGKDERLKYMLQYVVFGVICVPIGLFWSVRNLMLYNMPVNYIPPVGQQFPENTVFYRLFDFHMESVFPAMCELGDTYYEHNLFLSMLKSPLFGEYNYANYSGAFTPFCVMLFITGALLALLALVATILLVASKRSKLATEWRWFFGVLYVTLLASYCSFALKYFNFSAQDFRYAALTIVVESVLLGIFADGLDEGTKRDRILSIIIKGATAIFCICSFTVYFMLGFFKP